MKEEKKLRDSLIRRFIGVLMIVGIVEYLLITMSDKFVMPSPTAATFSGGWTFPSSSPAAGAFASRL